MNEMKGSEATSAADDRAAASSHSVGMKWLATFCVMSVLWLLLVAAMAMAASRFMNIFADFGTSIPSLTLLLLRLFHMPLLTVVTSGGLLLLGVGALVGFGRETSLGLRKIYVLVSLLLMFAAAILAILVLFQPLASLIQSAEGR